MRPHDSPTPRPHRQAATTTPGQSGPRRRRRGALSLSGTRQDPAQPATAAPGTTPGIESMEERNHPPPPGRVQMECVDYGPDRVERHAVENIEAFLSQARPEWATVRWLNVNGLHAFVVDRLRQHYGFHTLAAEDVLRVPQRPKVEAFDDHLYLVIRLLTLQHDHLVSEQVSLFLYPNLILTFQETVGDAWDPIRQRLERPTARLRKQGAAYLLYALLDAAVDHWFPILEYYGEALQTLEEQILTESTPRAQRRIHALKHDLASLRRVIWPVRELVQTLQRDERDEIPQAIKTYLRDVYDHAVQVMEIVETHRELAASLHDLYMSAVSNRMNEIMKVLTIMASFFIPITFVAGVYGMNFEHIPELSWDYSYLAFWLLCLSIAALLAVFFHRKGWIGPPRTPPEPPTQ